MLSGKEALINLSKTCMAYQEEFGRLKIDKKENEALQTLKEIVQKYDKYKRAFEILRKVLTMEIGESIDGKVKFHTLYFTGQFPYETYKYLEQEECELLEELMKSEKN